MQSSIWLECRLGDSEGLGGSGGKSKDNDRDLHGVGNTFAGMTDPKEKGKDEI